MATKKATNPPPPPEEWDFEKYCPKGEEVECRDYEYARNVPWLLEAFERHKFQMTASPAPYTDLDSQSNSTRFYRLKLIP